MKKFVSIVVFFISYCSFSQTGNILFNDTVVHTLSVEIDLPDWFATLEQDYQLNSSDPTTYPEIYRECKVSWDGVLLNNCGIREKGNASNSFTQFGKKKPFKIAFDAFANQTLDGIKKINLNNFTNDPSLMHDVVSFKLFRDAGLVASRTSYAKLIVNGEYIGLYAIIENVDKTFLKYHYGSANNNGNLYKTDRGASVFLDWLGTDKSAYKDKGLKLTTNESADDWDKMIAFIYFLNNNHDADFKQQLEKKFDVHGYLKILAIEKCIRSWDSYWGGGNNFYLYEHPDGKYRWIPWDMNETFQDLKMLSGTSILTGYLVPANKFDARPLLKRIFEFPEYKTEYLNYVCSLVNSNYTLNHLGEYILYRHNLIDFDYKSDSYRYNSYESFQNSLTTDNLDEVSITHSGYVLRINYPGIYPFIQSQREWAVDQIRAWDVDCSIEENTIYNLFVYPNPTDNYINIGNDFTGFEYAQFRLYDFTGKLCKITKYDIMQGDYYTLPLENISSGIYVLMKYSVDGKVGRAKIIIK
jgi:hypothetical protein